MNNAHENAAHIIGTELVDYDDRESLQCWDVSPELVYSFVGMHHVSDDAAKVDAMNWAIKNLFSHAGGFRLATFGSNAGAVHLAYSGVVQSIRWILRTGSRETVCDVIDCFARSKKFIAALTSLGFQFHPKISNMLTRGPHRELHRGLRKTIISILYHVDRGTLYQDLPDVYASLPAAPHGANPALREDNLGNVHSQAWQKAAFQHLVMMASSADNLDDSTIECMRIACNHPPRVSFAMQHCPPFPTRSLGPLR